MKRITEGAFAKLNLTLDVLDRRADGYHDIKSIMQTVSLHDDVHVTVGCEGWQIHCYREALPPDADGNTEPELVTCGLPQDRENLAWKAAEAFYARIGKKPAIFRAWSEIRSKSEIVCRNLDTSAFCLAVISRSVTLTR